MTDFAFCYVDHQTESCAIKADLVCQDVVMNSTTSDTCSSTLYCHDLLIDEIAQGTCSSTTITCSSASDQGSCIESGCDWTSKCTINDQVCQMPDVCEASGCHWEEDELLCISEEHEHEEANIVLNLWISSACILLVSILGSSIPIIFSRKYNKTFLLLLPYFDACTVGILVSVSFIHLLSESFLYAMSEGIFVLNSFLSPFFVFSAILFIMVLLDMALNFVVEKENSIKRIEIAVEYDIQQVVDTSSSDSEISVPTENSNLQNRLEFSVGISHIEKNTSPDTEPMKFASVALTTFGLVLHSLAEGAIVGLASEVVIVWTLTFSLVVHKFFVAIALGSACIGLNRLPALILVFSFAISTPLSILVAGYASVQASDYVMAYINALSSAFILSICVHIIGYQKKGKYTKTQYAIQSVVVVVSSACIFGLMYWHLQSHDHSALEHEH